MDDELGYIIGWMPVDDIRANAELMSGEKETELESAFQSLRTSSSPINCQQLDSQESLAIIVW